MPIPREANLAVQPRARGSVSLTVKARAGRSVLRGLYQAGSLKCLFPGTGRSDLEAVLLNTAGGVTGGDSFDFAAKAEAGTTLTMTTQACERAYKAQPGQVGQVRNALTIEDGARFNWLPQETILYERAALRRRLTVEMRGTASLLMVEPVLFGRTAMGETLPQASFADRIEIRRDGEMIYLDALRLDGDVFAHLAQPHVAGGAIAMASLVFVSNTAEAHLGTVRALLPERAGASLLWPGVLVARILAEDGFALRRTLLPLIRALNEGLLPRCWMI